MADESPLSVVVRPDDDGMAEVAVTLMPPDDGPGITAVLTPYQALVIGYSLVSYGMHFNNLNETLAQRTVEERKEIMDMHAQFNMPSATDSPFDPPVH